MREVRLKGGKTKELGHGSSSVNFSGLYDGHQGIWVGRDMSSVCLFFFFLFFFSSLVI